MTESELKARLLKVNRALSITYKVCEISTDTVHEMIVECIKDYCDSRGYELDQELTCWVVDGTPDWAYQDDELLAEMFNELFSLEQIKRFVSANAEIYSKFLEGLDLREDEVLSLDYLFTDLETESNER